MPALDWGLWTQETGNPGGLRRPRGHVHTRRAGPPEPGLASQVQHEAGGGLSAAFCVPAWGGRAPEPRGRAGVPGTPSVLSRAGRPLPSG